MGRYVAGRLGQLVIVFLGATLLIYFAVYVLPGDPIQGLLGDRQATPEQMAALRELYHLDDPLFSRYVSYLGNVLQGDLGTDLYGRPVTDLMAQRWPVTLQLGMTAWLLEIILGIGFGVYAAIRNAKMGDRVVLFVSITVISIPLFVTAATAQWLFGVEFSFFPISGIADGWPQSYILPALILAAFGMASVSRLVRSSVIENLRADYVRTAYAKGASEFGVLVRHVLRNSLIPVVTYLALDLGYLLGGTVIVEGIFNLPGVGQLLFTSLRAQQGEVVVGVATCLVLIFLVLNLVVDLLYGVLDPRIRRG